MSDFPTASSVESKVVIEAVDMETMIISVKSLGTSDLFKIMKQALALAEKRSSSAVPRSKAVEKDKKTGSNPKGVVPPQLRRPCAWVDFTEKHALENGWESFTVFQSKKDKMTGEKIEEEIEMPCSEMYEGAHVYEGSITEKKPGGKPLTHKDAMSLSKQRWAPKKNSGTHEELYKEFLDGYVVEAVDSDVASVASTKTKKEVVKMTAAEKATEIETKKAEKAALKAVEKAKKDAEKAVEKAKKDAEKAVEKAKKDADKAEKAKNKTVKKPTVPVAAVAKKIVPAAAVATVAVSAASRIAAVAKKAAAPVKIIKNPLHPLPHKAEEWTCPSDGMVHPWAYKGKNYLRNSENETWLRGEDGGCGEWQGIYLVKENRIDDSVPEPEFEDDA